MQKIFAQVANVGFVPGNIWYSKDPFEEGDKIKIYTFIFNPDNKELSGTVIFFNKTVLLGKKDFIIAGKTAKDVSLDWTVTVGDHAIFAKIENAKFLISKGKYQEVYLAENETEKNARTVSKKIIPKSIDSDINFISQVVDKGFTSVSDITKTIEKNTPGFITESIISTKNSLEAFRENIRTTSEDKKEEIGKEIENLNKTKTAMNSKTTTNPLLKPFKYAELFFLSIFLFILNNKIIFYSIIFIIIFFILRYIWHKIF